MSFIPQNTCPGDRNGYNRGWSCQPAGAPRNPGTQFQCIFCLRLVITPALAQHAWSSWGRRT